MTIHRPSPELLDRLAAEYALGTMRGGARRRVAKALATEPAWAQAVMRWQDRLLPLDGRVAPLPAGDALWSRIEQQAFGARGASAPGPVAAVQRWWQRLLAPLPAGALALGLLMGSVAPGLWQQLQGGIETQLPESYVGVLATAEGRQGLIVSSLRRGRVVDIKPITLVAVPAGQTLFLWSLDAKGEPQPIAALPLPGTGALFSLPLQQPAEALFQRAVELAVSLEPAGSTPTKPGGPYVYRGLCGKLWPVARPASAPAR